MNLSGTSGVALLVEDEGMLSLVMNDLLTSEGFEVILAFDESDVVGQVTDNLAVAVVDLSLAGDIAGQRIIRFLRKDQPNLPVVVVTGYACDAEQADLRGLGGPMIRLHKPEHLDKLAAAVRTVINDRYTNNKLTFYQRSSDNY